MEIFKTHFIKYPHLNILFIAHIGLVMFLTSLSFIGIVEGEKFSTITKADTLVQMILFILPVLVSFASLAFWISLLWKKGWSIIVMILSSLCFMIIFLALMIITVYGMTHWISNDWSTKAVEKRIEYETEVCFLSLFHSFKNDDISK